MSFETIWFIRAGLIYFGLGVILGLTMALQPAWVGYLRPVHAHLNLLGFASMFIFGVAYHVVPRFKGKVLHSQALARTHLILSNVALVGMAGSFPLVYTAGRAGGYALAVFGSLQVVAAGMFIYNLWRTMD
ncbi:MAG TPA: hypothetical protein V6D00_08470 [Pantanalinema sp.]